MAVALVFGCGSANAAVPTEHAAALSVPQPQSGPAPSAPVDCGKVDSPTGKVSLIAEPTKAGTAGCTEAINVLSDYFAQAPTKSEGTAHVLTVAGWRCMADTGAAGSGRIGCDKNGLAFHTQR